MPLSEVDEDMTDKPVTCGNCGAVLGHAKTKKEAMDLVTEHAPKCGGKELDMEDDIAEAQRRAIVKLRATKR